MDNFEKIYIKVRPIVMKMRRFYYVRDWERDDWQQEGRLILYRLICQYPKLLEEDELVFYRYFKTKFSSHIKDVIRSQESLKRQFHKMAYTEIGEVEHVIRGSEMFLDDYVAYCDVLKRVEKRLTSGEMEMLERVMRGECFKGRKAFLRKIEPLFKDFKGDNLK
ncbi:MAG: competence protein ComX [Streptococcus orisratti]|uniref:competence protein ComX n=1 Tax=Streptococcus orisratti TaxID=114652 RepID=UPI002A90B1A4|nr:competence protein ComX [Streptococcus orisratti]MDY5636948.1 competence protein ComX [Streptococcus orisratti]